ncbi:MAG TPA: ATP-binding protein [Xanthobacteraceae bacterium]|nr:ATP-binding protein [Xanthobacteraceae bacterium]
MDMADLKADDSPADRAEAAGSIRLVLVVALALVGAVVSLLLFGRDNADPWIIGLLTVLAVAGVFALFAGAAGLLRFGAPDQRGALTRRIVDGAADGVVAVDALGRVLYANPRYREIVGADSVEDIRPVERLFTSDPDASEAVYRLAQAAREGRALAEEVRVPGAAGEPGRWLKLGARPAGREPRFARTAIWTVSDVTRDRERQENAFLELQHAIDYLDHAPAGFFSVGPDGAILYINATLVGWLGYDLAEFGPGGLSVGELVPGPAATLLTGLAPTPGSVRTEVIDLDLRRKNGQTLPVRLWHRVAFASDGTPGASRTLVVNRSREDNAADPLRAAEVRFARFFHNSPVAIATADRQRRVVQANAMFARLFGGAEAGEGRRVGELVAERDRAALDAALEAALEGRPSGAPVDFTLAGESTRSARFYVAPVEDGGTGGEAAILYAIDTTEQRALEAQFARSQKMQAVGQLAGGVAHDFNNLLTAILGYSDLLLTNSRPTDPSFQDVMQIKQNANRAAGLVRQLLAFSSRQTLRPQILNLGDVMSDLSMLLRRLLGEQVKLEVKQGRDLWPVKADLNQFEQVVVNLAVNARDAMPDGGTLTIRTANVPREEAERYHEAGLPDADHVLVEVEDTGTGIPPEIIDKIFEPFFSTKEVGKGTGLGLSTVYGIVQQTGGTLQVDSVTGRGSVFRVFLPRHMLAAGEAVSKVEAAPKAADLTGRGTLLLVEDEQGVRAFAARALASRGYQVLEAASGVEALEVMAERGDEVELVLSDVVMPEMDGPTLLRELRAKHPELKFIFMSGYAEDAFARNLPDGAAFGFLPKPFTLKQLIGAVKDAFGETG